MADRFPRYRPLGVQIGSVPSVDYLSAGAQTARGYEAMSRALDRVSSFAFQAVEERRKQEGLQYGAQNAPTEEQLKEAIESGRPIDLPGGEYSVFGQNARAAALRAATDELEYIGRQKISSLALQAKDGTIEPEQLQIEVQAVVDGVSSSIAKEDASVARKLRASLGVVGNSAYVSAAKDFIVKKENQKKVFAAAFVDEMTKSIPLIVDAGDTTGPDGKLITFEQKIEAQRMRALNAYAALGDVEGAKQAMAKFDKALQSIRIYEAERFVSSEDTSMQDVYAFTAEGAVPPNTKLSRLLETATPEQRSEIMQKAIEAKKRINNLYEQREVKAERERKNVIRGAETYFFGRFSRNPDAFDDTSITEALNGQRMSQLGAEVMRKEMTRKSDPSNNPFVQNDISDRINEGRDMHETILRARLNDQLGEVEFLSLLKRNAESQVRRYAFETKDEREREEAKLEAAGERADKEAQKFKNERAKEFWNFTKKMLGSQELEAKIFTRALTESDNTQAQNIANAELEFHERVRAGEDAKAVSDDLIERYAPRKVAPRALSGVPITMPKDEQQVRAMEKEFERRLRAGKITKDEYTKQLGLLVEWDKYVTPQKKQSASKKGGE